LIKTRVDGTYGNSVQDLRKTRSIREDAA
jgi:hypothetical protein